MYIYTLLLSLEELPPLFSVPSPFFSVLFCATFLPIGEENFFVSLLGMHLRGGVNFGFFPLKLPVYGSRPMMRVISVQIRY